MYATITQEIPELASDIPPITVSQEAKGQLSNWSLVAHGQDRILQMSKLARRSVLKLRDHAGRELWQLHKILVGRRVEPRLLLVASPSRTTERAGPLSGTLERDP